jgi:hypothetical protein
MMRDAHFDCGDDKTARKKLNNGHIVIEPEKLPFL